MDLRKPMQLRLPSDLKSWLENEAARNGNSQNSEVIRALRAEQDRQKVQKQIAPWPSLALTNCAGARK